MAKKIYETMSRFTVIARQLEEDEYFGNIMAHKGDYIVKVNDNEYRMDAELFESIFQMSYANLQDFIDQNRDKYDDVTLDILAACFERDH
jgi:hypothetical protein